MQLKPCPICNCVDGHNSLCPHNILNSDAMSYRMEQSDEEYFEEQIGNGTREDVEAYFFNEECGDR